MSSNSTSAQTLQSVALYITSTINWISLFIGTIGSICSIVTFIAPELRRNASVFYLLCISIFELLSILFIVVTRIALDNFGSRLERQSIIFCKFRYYIVIVLPELVTSYMLLAVIDRFLITSKQAGIRAWSNIKSARRLSLIILIIIPITNIHLLFFYQIYNQNCQIPPNTIYTIFATVYLVVIISILPHTVILIFFCLTFRNIRKLKRRVIPDGTNTQQRQTKRYDSQLFLVIGIQMCLTSVFLALRMVSHCYSALTSANIYKSIESKAIEYLSNNLGISLFYFSYSISFYASILTSKYFRKIFYKQILCIYRRF